MNIEVGERALVTFDGWFYAPDGKTYRAAFGTVRAIRTDSDTLGIKTNARSTNWYLELGCLTVAGCQIHYAVRVDKPQLGDVDDHRVTAEGSVQRFRRPSEVFDADA